MALSMNKVILIGNLGKDAETRFTADNTFAITNFSIATSRSYKNKENAWTDETTWHNIVGYNLSDSVKNGLQKGKKIAVEGRISNRNYTDKDGNKKYVFEIIAETIIPLQANDSQNTDVHKNSESGSSVNEENLDLPF